MGSGLPGRDPPAPWSEHKRGVGATKAAVIALTVLGGAPVVKSVAELAS